MASGFISYVVKSYYIYGQFLLHLWMVLGLCFFTFMGNTAAAVFAYPQGLKIVTTCILCLC